jgi:hypothetical protein
LIKIISPKEKGKVFTLLVKGLSYKEIAALCFCHRANPQQSYQKHLSETKCAFKSRYWLAKYGVNKIHVKLIKK